MINSAPLALLRARLAQDGFDAFLAPRADDYLGEYVAANAERLAWLTGFTGSAGAALVTAESAWLFVDGRYTLQAEREVTGTGIQVVHVSDRSLYDHLGPLLPKGARLAYDPWLFSSDQAGHLNNTCKRFGASLVAVSVNPVDDVWTNRPPPPLAPIVPHPQDYCGQSWDKKLIQVAKSLEADQVDAVILADPASVAWTLNLRGGDVPFTPLPLSRAILYRNGPRLDLFADPRKCGPELRAAFDDRVTILPPEALNDALDRLGTERAKVRVDGSATPAAITQRLDAAGAFLDRGADPCQMPRACKNPVELAGMRAAHRRDGAALVRFLAWLSRQDGALGTIDELVVADRVQTFRAEGRHFRGLSFPTIAGFGPNGAIVHYRGTPETALTLTEGELLLLDSGAQYLDGTTDVTRTIAIGLIQDAERRRRYTQVLKGNIAISRAIFPVGTTGSQLDILARQALWADGVDYDHGTGHGVGCFLSVHEGPQRISKSASTVKLAPGMILSNEPGYYKPEHYGIRLETLLAVVESPAPSGAERPLLGFEVLTLVPFDLSMIALDLLTLDEIAWLDSYHQRIAESLAPLLDPQDFSWLARATLPVMEKGILT